MEIAGLSPEEIAVRATRRALAHVYIRGEGIEVGSGDRPVLLPEGVVCHYGDIREPEALEKYFGEGTAARTPVPSFVDAQSFEGVPDSILDFVISAHVTEHLRDALGAISGAIRALKPGGIFMLILPDKRYTFDHARPITPLAHLIEDAKDRGAGTVLEAYRDTGRFNHDWGGREPTERELDEYASASLAAGMDVHFHTWDTESFKQMIDYVSRILPIECLTLVPVVNENIAILRKTSTRLLDRIPRLWQLLPAAKRAVGLPGRLRSSHPISASELRNRSFR
jgi:SAM-dependent methyltransferase